MLSKSVRSACAGCLYAGPLIVSIAAFGQTSSGSGGATPAAQGAGKIEEVTVTARRASERAQSSAVSVTAFSGRTLRRKNIAKTSDLMFSTPGVYLSGSGGRENSVYEIRGQSKALSGTNAAAVVSYFDDVPQTIFGSNVDIYDMQNVQVLKGPQGTLFGRNTTGGAVLFYPVAPSYTTNGYLQTGYGTYNDRQVEGAVNVPLVKDKVALRVSGQYDERDGYTKNLGVGGPLDDANIKAWRTSLLLDPTPWLHNVTVYDYYSNNYAGDGTELDSIDSNPALIDLLGVRAAAEQYLQQQRKNGYLVTDSDVDPAKNETRKSSLTNHTNIDLGNGYSITNIFGYRRTAVVYTGNADGVPTLDSTVYGLPVTFINGGAIEHTEQFTEEVQLKGKLIHDRLNWLLGGFYLSSDPYGVTGTGDGLGQPVLDPKKLPSPVENFSYNNQYETSRALFGNANYDFSDWVQGLHFDAGVRFTYDHVKACTATDLTTDGAIGPSGCKNGNPVLIDASTNSANSHKPTWQFGLDWRINKALFAYIAQRRGYREGGINSPTFGGTLAGLQDFGPETVTDVEAGIKTDYAFGRVQTRFNIDAFDGYYSGVQVPLSGLVTQPGCIAGNAVYGKPPYSPDGDCNANNDPNSGTLLVNAGKSRVDGIDFDGAIAPTRNLTVTFGGNVVDPETTSFSVPSAVDYYVGSRNIPFNMVSKLTLTFGAQYAVPMGRFGSLLFSENTYYTSRVFFTQIYLNPYSVTNFRIDWNRIYEKPVDLSFYITNAFDRRYEAIGSVTGSALGLNSAIWGPPQQFGFQLRYEFGGGHG